MHGKEKFQFFFCFCFFHVAWLPGCLAASHYVTTHGWWSAWKKHSELLIVVLRKLRTFSRLRRSSQIPRCASWIEEAVELCEILNLRWFSYTSTGNKTLDLYWTVFYCVFKQLIFFFMNVASIILFLPTTFTRTHDPRHLPTTHDTRHLATSVAKCSGSWVWGSVVGKNKIIVAKFMKKISIIWKDDILTTIKSSNFMQTKRIFYA